jgi:hypothetical protein
MRTQIQSWAGFALYFISFFTPSIGNPDFHQKTDMLAHALPGWNCAFFSVYLGAAGIIAIFHPSGLTSEGRQSFVSLLLPGLVNPLLLTYLVLALRGRAARLRRTIAIIIPFFIASSAITFAVIPFKPLVGFYLWMAGSILALLPDLLQMTHDIRVRWTRSNA